MKVGMKNRIVAFVSAVLIIVLCFSPGLKAHAQSHDDHGKALYRNHCQFCHGANGDGNGPAASSMYPSPSDFTDPRFWKTITDDRIADIIRNGRGMMPAFRFSSGDIKSLIDYISHFKSSGK